MSDRLPIHNRTILPRRLVTRHKSHRRTIISMSQRNPRISRRSNSRRNPRNHLHRHPNIYQILHLLTTATEYKRIASLQPHHNGIILNLLNQQLSNLILRQRMSSPPLTRINFFCLRINHRQNSRTHQSIINNHIRTFQQPLTLQSKQPRISRPRTHQINLTHKLPHSLALSSSAFLLFLGVLGILAVR